MTTRILHRFPTSTFTLVNETLKTMERLKIRKDWWRAQRHRHAERFSSRRTELRWGNIMMNVFIFVSTRVYTYSTYECTYSIIKRFTLRYQLRLCYRDWYRVRAFFLTWVVIRWKVANYEIILICQGFDATVLFLEGFFSILWLNKSFSI